MQSLPAPLRVTWQALVIWWDELINLFILNLVWLGCWITIVLGPPATFGMYHSTRLLVDGYIPNLRDFYKGARQHLALSWAWMLANLILLMVLATNVWFYGEIGASWARYVQPIFLALIPIWLVVQFYALPYLMIQEEKSLKLAWKNGLFTALASPGYTLVLLVVIILIAGLTVVAILPLFLGTGFFIAILGNQAVQERVELFKSLKAGEEDLARSEEDED